jgi:hypothetical protein
MESIQNIPFSSTVFNMPKMKRKNISQSARKLDGKTSKGLLVFWFNNFRFYIIR